MNGVVTLLRVQITGVRDDVWSHRDLHLAQIRLTDQGILPQL
jgi:hypothetical protein